MAIRELIKEKRKGRRKWQQARDSIDKRILNNKTKILKEKSKNGRKDPSIVRYLRDLTVGQELNKSLIKATKSINKTRVHHIEGSQKLLNLVNYQIKNNFRGKCHCHRLFKLFQKTKTIN